MRDGHGGNIYQAAKIEGCLPSEITDMSSNISAVPLPHAIKNILTERISEIAQLPEVESASLTQLIAEKHRLSPEQILLGNGTTEFIFSIPERLRPESALILAPTYSDYADACALSSVSTRFLFTEKENRFQPDPHQLKDLAGKANLVFLCNPNNPTGALIPKGDILNCVESFPDTFFVVDESYLPFVEEEEAHTLLSHSLPHNLMVLRSFSKIYAIPGLRLGWLAASPKTASLLRKKMPPWNVNRLAQIAGEAILDDPALIPKAVNQNLTAKNDFLRELNRFSDVFGEGEAITVYPGTANFLLLELTGSMNAPDFTRLMLDNKILVRDCSNFEGLGDRFIRISLKTREMNGLCLAAMKEIMT